MPPRSAAQRLGRTLRNLSRIVARKAYSPKPSQFRPVFLLLLSFVVLVFLFSNRLSPSPTYIPPTFDVSANVLQHPCRIVLIIPPLTNHLPNPNPSLSITPPIYNIESLTNLLTSLQSAHYTEAINLDIIVAPAANHTAFLSVYYAVTKFLWTHGSINIRNATSGGQFHLFISSWNPVQQEDAILIDASRAEPLASNFYTYLKHARQYHSHADIAGFSIHSLKTLSDTSSAVTLYQHTPYLPVFSPLNADTWRAFQRWFYAHRGEWFLWPVVYAPKDKKDASWDEFRGTGRAHWTMWLGRFCAEYRLYNVYPSGGGWDKTPKRYDYRGAVVKKAGVNVDKIVELGMSGGGSVSITVVNEAFLETAKSWICNVDVAKIRPPGVVWITTDDVAYNGLKDINNSYAIRMTEFRGGTSAKGTSYGTPGYWKLMLERTLMIREILERGVGVFAFETDQIWLRDPVPFVKRLVGSGDEVDVVGTLDTRHEIGGNFLYLKPSLATRRTWREVCDRFEKAYHRHGMDGHSKKFRRYMENDQSTLTKLLFFDHEFKERNPTVFRALDTELFVDGRWYSGGKYYKSKKSRSPVLINNNFLIGIDQKKQRAKTHGHWFGERCDRDMVVKAVRENEQRAGMGGNDADVEVDAAVVMAAITKEQKA